MAINVRRNVLKFVHVNVLLSETFAKRKFTCARISYYFCHIWRSIVYGQMLSQHHLCIGQLCVATEFLVHCTTYVDSYL